MLFPCLALGGALATSPIHGILFQPMGMDAKDGGRPALAGMAELGAVGTIKLRLKARGDNLLHDDITHLTTPFPYPLAFNQLSHLAQIKTWTPRLAPHHPFRDSTTGTLQKPNYAYPP